MIACGSGTETILVKECQNPDHVIPRGRGGMQAKASKIVILCYYVSIFYSINYYKIIHNIKNYQALPTPPTGGGVWCDTPAVNG